MAAYVFALVDVHDDQGFAAYRTAFGATIGPFDGTVLAADDTPVTLEGEWPPGRTVILEFADAETASAWFHSEAYQQASELRRASSTTQMIIVDGHASS